MNIEKLKEAIQFFRIEGIMEYGDGNMKIALSLLLEASQAVLSASECFEDKRDKNWSCSSCCDERDSCNCYREQYNMAREEDITTLAKKLVGLEEVIGKARRQMPINYVPTPEMYKYLATAIQTHLSKPEGKEKS